MPSLLNLSGHRFGMLTVISRVNNDQRFNKVQWLCRCDCGTEKVVYSNRLRQSGDGISCGCFHRKRAADTARSNFTTHGLTFTDEYDMWRRAKGRAQKEGIPFSISVHDIVIPEYCPALGIKLVRHKDMQFGQPDSPSLDRLIPEKGYIPKNIRVISNKANTIKQRASADDLMKIARWLENELSG